MVIDDGNKGVSTSAPKTMSLLQVVPLEIGFNPVRHFNRVVLPAPFGPKIPRVLPFGTENSIFRKTCFVP